MRPSLRHLQAVCVIFSVVSVYINSEFLPFYKPAMNIANILHSCVFALATLMFLCAEFRKHPEVSFGYGDWALCFCCA